MAVRVIIPPAAIVAPADIPGDHAAADAAVSRMISAATRTIDGPSGWLGRALGPQTLEYRCWPECQRIPLPYPPIIDIASVAWRDKEGEDTPLVEETDWQIDQDELALKTGAWPPHRCRELIVRYQAGYDGAEVEAGGTGAVPDEVKTAIILMVQHMMMTNRSEAFVSSEDVPDVAAIRYSAPDRAAEFVRRQVDKLLDGLRVYA